MQFVFLVFFALISLPGFSQTINVQHYRFEIKLSDDNDKINCRTSVALSFPQSTKDFSLDLVQTKRNGHGMKVEEVRGKNVNSFQQVNDKIQIELKNTSLKETKDTFEIIYSGIPDDGLIISKNKFGDRTFFSDNWPNRARHWIPCNDVPDDKASVEFIVTAPAYYQVVSNGLQVEETNLDKKQKLTHWKELTPISTKIMVIGVARFAVARLDGQCAVPVTAWVYPENKEKGFYDYSVAGDILQFFTQYIGPFPFQKLANVQSTTIFGGMENASAIFYDERAIDGKRTSEPTIAHEIAHQWFGDMATEKNFAHLWLSEGFATYLTNIYWEQKYGKAEADKQLLEEKEKVIAFTHINNHAVVDSLSDLMDLLNANSYQKGGWVLHMLRGEVGDAAFQKIIQDYYQQYKGGNADTRDFQNVAEIFSGKYLDYFFIQWLYRPGIPKINAQWKIQGNQAAITIQQTGKNVFQFPLIIGYYVAGGKMQAKKINVTKATETFTLPINTKPVKLVLDPFVELLFEGNISEGR